DAVKPGPQRRPTLELVVGLPRAHEGLLDQVLGVVHRSHHPVAVRQQLSPIRVGEADEVIGVRGRGHGGPSRSESRDRRYATTPTTDDVFAYAWNRQLGRR